MRWPVNRCEGEEEEEEDKYTFIHLHNERTIFNFLNVRREGEKVISCGKVQKSIYLHFLSFSVYTQRVIDLTNQEKITCITHQLS